ncbi:MAG: mitochondrial fission ELM1 family protein [Marinobacter sp.]|nr:mitochondrial fission ELM1 family protein [Marinobacter sp.]
MRDSTRPIIWLLTDEKPGHKSQLRGLANRLKTHAAAKSWWIDCREVAVGRLHAMLGRRPASLDVPEEFAQPDLIIAAGQSTHRLMEALRRQPAMKVVLMRPSFPQRWMDACIIPAHDTPKPGPNLLITTGVLNAVAPLARLTDKRQALVLLGGPSRHYQWDEADLVHQLQLLRDHYPEWQWVISTSRRTPESTLRAIQPLASPRFKLVDYRDTHSQWHAHTLSDSRAVWVTPDSASMVYESVTSGVPTGLFNLPAGKSERVSQGIRQLVNQNMAHTLDDHRQVMQHTGHEPSNSLWEADRAARWLLERWQQGPARR